ncbi:MAG: EAL domain-containing protein [Pseudomonadota bacterium]
MENSPEHFKNLTLCSINLSGISIGNEKVLRCILDSFSSMKNASEKICFEITETAAIADIDVAIKFMMQLRKHGFRFSLDDFGSGLSSFFYLKKLPIDYVKIDGLFVKNMDSDKVNYMMVKAITEVSHAMGKQVIAEYVENEIIRDCLNEIGVDFAQGYYYAKPELITL